MTVLLVAVNVAVFLLLQPRGGCPEAAFVFEFAAIPRELLSLDALTTEQLAQRIGTSCARTVGEKSVLWSAVSAMFLHGSLIHLAGNMLFLWVFGNNVEDRLGHLRYLGFYLGGGLVATYVFAVLNAGSTQPLLGASGAVAAVLGAYLVLYPKATVHAYAPFPLYLLAYILPRVRVTAWFLIFAIVSLPAWLALLAWFGLQVSAASNPVADGVAYSAHVAGFVAGLVLVILLDRRHVKHGQPTWRVPPPTGPRRG